MVQISLPAERQGAGMGDGEQGQRGKQGDPAIDLDLAVSVGPVPDQAGAG